VLCNREIKFGSGLRYARRLGGRWFATGHYARLQPHGDTVRLLKAVDAGKDQTYFLHAVQPADLSCALMPLGGYTKPQVRNLARSAGLPVFDKPDSTGICFIGERPFREFLGRYLDEAPGPIETPEGKRLGMHCGLAFYTLGQRGGLGLGGRCDSEATPWYVAAKDPSRNALIVVQGHDHPLLCARELLCADLQWLVTAPDEPLRCTVRVRHRHADQPATLFVGPNRTARITFDQPQRALTPGQFAVAYSGDLCLGGGTITAVTTSAAGALAARPEPGPALEEQFVKVARRG
jgi:tRNA-specific 2-thiouridylase